MSGKRGQITAFIIVGLVLLFSIIMLSVIKEESIMFPEEPVQPELEPLAEYTVQCVEEVGESAIRLLGMGGGYLETPNEISVNPLEYVSMGPIKLPLWYYEGESRIPTKQGLETQISSYVVDRINNCLKDYEDFQAQYDMNLAGEVSAETIISSESVDVTLTYPLKVVTKVEFKEMDLPPVRARIPIRLGKVFELAAAINEYENTEFFLEQLTNDWISTSGFPYEGSTFQCGDLSFSKSEMKEELVDALRANFKYLTFANTDYSDPRLDENLAALSFTLDGEEYNYGHYYATNYHFEVSDESFSGIQVLNEIDDTSWYRFEVDPSTGDRVTPIDLMPIVNQCYKVFHHKYDVELPVIFRLVDSYQNNNYEFVFALPMNMEDNEPARPYPQDNPFFRVEPGDLEIRTEDYCADTYPVEFEVYAKDPTPGMPNSGMMPGVDVSYQCVQYLCGIGQTTDYPMGDWPSLRAEFPECINGLLILEKEGYLTTTDFVTIQPGMDETYKFVDMTPVKSLGYSFRVVEYLEGNVVERDLLANESVILTIRNYANNLDLTIVYPEPEETTYDLSLIEDDLNYSVEIYMIYNDEIMRGGYKIDNWNPSMEDIANSNHAELKIITKKPYPVIAQDFVELWDDYMVGKASQHLPELELR